MRIVVNISGAALDNVDLRGRCAHALCDLVGEGHKAVVIHGGGNLLQDSLARANNGGGLLDELAGMNAEMRNMAMGLVAGRVNKGLVAAIGLSGQPAIGICGGDGLTARARRRTPDAGFLGEITDFNPRWIEQIWRESTVPVLSNFALGFDYEYYWVNADRMSAACAVACRAHALIFLTDSPGIENADGTVVRWLDVSRVHAMIQTSAVGRDMSAKLEACSQALKSGVNRVRILPSAEPEALQQFYSARIQSGTEVMVG